MILNGTEYAYIRNAQNDIVGLIDSAGVQVASYTYSTWGEVTLLEDTSTVSLGTKNPYLYRGYRYDSETGLYYLQSRYYNPQWGRFLNADTLFGTTDELLSKNTFTYCFNNPVNMIDETGLLPYDLFKKADDAAADFALYANTLTDMDGLERGAFIYKKFVWGKGFRYYYTDIFKGQHNNVAYGFASRYVNLVNKKRLLVAFSTVSFVHTHPFCSEHDGENFSSADLALTWFPGIASVYLSTPSGKLYKVSKFSASQPKKPIRSNLPIMKKYRYY